MPQIANAFYSSVRIMNTDTNYETIINFIGAQRLAGLEQLRTVCMQLHKPSLNLKVGGGRARVPTLPTEKAPATHARS